MEQISYFALSLHHVAVQTRKNKIVLTINIRNEKIKMRTTADDPSVVRASSSGVRLNDVTAMLSANNIVTTIILLRNIGTTRHSTTYLRMYESRMYIHTHMHARASTHTHTPTCIRRIAHMHAYMHTHRHRHKHTHAHTHTRTHAHTHTRTHARTHTHTLPGVHLKCNVKSNSYCSYHSLVTHQPPYFASLLHIYHTEQLIYLEATYFLY